MVLGCKKVGNTVRPVNAYRKRRLDMVIKCFPECVSAHKILIDGPRCYFVRESNEIRVRLNLVPKKHDFEIVGGASQIL